MTADRTKGCTVVLHDLRVSSHDVLCGTRILLPGELGYLSAPGARTICISPAPTPLGVTVNSEEVSLHVSLAERFGFENRLAASVQLVEQEAAMAMHVEIFFRDQWLSRADMWQMMRGVDELVVYRGQPLAYLGSTTAEVKKIYISGTEVDSALVTHPQTKLIFRSGSARFTILIEVSREMLRDWSAGELLCEKCVDGYLRDLFNRWTTQKMKHQVTVVLFGRVCSFDDALGHEANLQSHKHTHCKDFFEVITSGTPSTAWPEILRKLRKVFNSSHLPQSVSSSAQSNILEAIQLAVIDYSDEQTDTYLASTGASIIAVTAGTGLFEAQHALLTDTTNLLIGNGIGVDLVALSPKPLHPVPLFQYDHDGTTAFALPHWVDISFWKRPYQTDTSIWTLPHTEEPLLNVALPLLESSQIPSFDTSSADNFDAWVFEHPLPLLDDPVKNSTSQAPPRRDPVGSVETIRDPHRENHPVRTKSSTARISSLKVGLANVEAASPGFSKTPLNRTQEQAPTRPPIQPSRKISLGPRGLAPGRSVASTTLSSAYAQQEKDLVSGPSHSAVDMPSSLASVIRATLARKSSQQSLSSLRVSDPDHSHYTRPIDIHTGHEARSTSDEASDPASLVEKRIADSMVGATLNEEEEDNSASASVSASATPKAGDYFNNRPLSKRNACTFNDLDMHSPWVMLLNPCDPRRDNMRIASQYRKWQHIFPRAISSGSFKWTSMCTPGSLPLTAEYRPSAAELEAHYSKRVRRHVISNSVGLQHDTARNLVERLVNIRLLRGFQIVALANSNAEQACQPKEAPILLARGRVYHELQRPSDFEVQLVLYEPIDIENKYEGRTDLDVSSSYNPKIRINGEDVITNEVWQPPKPSIVDWNTLDEHILGLSPLVDRAAAFKMRLVLLPVESVKVAANTNMRWTELSDDERRIEGIQWLTQLWQRQRRITSEDQQHQGSLVRPNKPFTNDAARDPNPLAIEYHTRDLSVVINSQGLHLANPMGSGEVISDLFAESEKHHSTSFDILKLVKQMQELPPYGVEMRDRRWLTVTHVKCFRGDEMTTWLLGVFKDLELREHAVELGNELMNRGVFAHVRQKHAFRDGHYFYQITAAYRTTDYPDTTGLFSKVVPWRTVPSTPLADSIASPALRPISGDSSSSDKSSTTGPSASNESKRILLSQKMHINVDPQRTSDHAQVVELHYDRIHNPDNCYHIHLEWLDTSATLIREAMDRWTSQVDAYGLKLVQVPLQEASKYHAAHPFDAPRAVTLALRPPNKPLATPFIEPRSGGSNIDNETDTTTNTPRPSPHPSRSTGSEQSAFPYHRALLRKHGFILDLEAASAFPNRFHVAYSWGPLSYTYTQFVHRSGLLLAQILGGDDHQTAGAADFLLLPNRLAPPRFTSRGGFDHGASGATHTAPGAPIPTAESLLANFRAICADADALARIYQDVDHPRTNVTLVQPSPFWPGVSLADGDVPPMQLPPHMILPSGQQTGTRS